MPSYNVPIDTFNNFKNYVNGKGFDVDGSYGYQCWDGLQLLWQQLGMWLSTDGTHYVYGCWNERVRASNAGDQFYLIYNLADVKVGDVMIFDHGSPWGEAGHGGYACENYNNGDRIQLLSQNYRNSSATHGSPFSIDNARVVRFRGAFRYKGWNGEPGPGPGPGPSPSAHRRSNFPWVLYGNRLRHGRS